MSDFADAFFGRDSSMGKLFELPKDIFDTGLDVGKNVLHSGSKILTGMLKFFENPLFMLAIGGIVLVLIFKFIK